MPLLVKQPKFRQVGNLGLSSDRCDVCAHAAVKLCSPTHKLLCRLCIPAQMLMDFKGAQE
jgi:hypothetical protein